MENNGIDSKLLSKNNSKNAIKLLEEYPDLIEWYYLSSNSSAIKLIKNNKNKINYGGLALNPNEEVIELLLEDTTKFNWNLIGI